MVRELTEAGLESTPLDLRSRVVGTLRDDGRRGVVGMEA